MDLKIAKAHIHMLGFTQLKDGRGNPSPLYYTNNKGMVLQYSGHPNPFWNSSLLCSSGCTKPTRKLAEFLNGY